MDDNNSQTPQDDPFTGPRNIPVIDPDAPDGVTESTEEAQPTDKASGDDPFKVGTAFNYLQNLQTQINLNIAKIDKLKEDIQPVKEMIDDLLNNDPEYLELTKKAKDASTEKGSRKKELLSQPQGKALQDKMEELKNEQKEANDMISQLLDEYRKETGANEFEGPDGELRTIVTVAKLVRKTNLNRD